MFRSAALKEAFKILMLSPNTKALDEIGLDLTARGVKKQEKTLQYLFRGFADPSRPVILHLRGHKGKEDEVYFHELNLVGPCLPREQPIQLHCFSGSAVAFAQWQKRFPDEYARFSGLVSSFEEHQKQGLRAVPGDRLLLETDSPYLPTVGRGVGNTPHHVGHVAMLVSQVRQQPVLDLTELANANLKRLFRL
ncbi:3'-5' ssDNA/RNA exonuclease tatd [Plakobranchus ocellatus]|uniref:3'-5' ssDNA/RNA exonuclease tatd n=1 Tax=Plakobranchus ocellatus TaxID=259542 RepID=A0AAV4E2Z4_9GAST|nr:3'-5' ssDNA/RNA exonuclease tatd [Plakobranchus ocellatus]